jgi:hypothetical protein
VLLGNPRPPTTTKKHREIAYRSSTRLRLDPVLAQRGSRQQVVILLVWQQKGCVIYRACMLTLVSAGTETIPGPAYH